MALTLICSSGVQAAGAPVCAADAEVSIRRASVAFAKVFIFVFLRVDGMSVGFGKTSERGRHPNSRRGLSLAGRVNHRATEAQLGANSSTNCASVALWLSSGYGLRAEVTGRAMPRLMSTLTSTRRFCAR